MDYGHFTGWRRSRADVQAAVDEEGIRASGRAAVEPVAAVASGNQPQKGPAIFMNHTLQFTVIIPTFYVSVVHLFMKTAIVLRTVGGSQTTNQLQVKVIVLRTQ